MQRRGTPRACVAVLASRVLRVSRRVLTHRTPQRRGALRDCTAAYVSRVLRVVARRPVGVVYVVVVGDPRGVALAAPAARLSLLTW